MESTSALFPALRSRVSEVTVARLSTRPASASASTRTVTVTVVVAPFASEPRAHVTVLDVDAAH